MTEHSLPPESSPVQRALASEQAAKLERDRDYWRRDAKRCAIAHDKLADALVAIADPDFFLTWTDAVNCAREALRDAHNQERDPASGPKQWVSVKVVGDPEKLKDAYNQDRDPAKERP